MPCSILSTFSTEPKRYQNSGLHKDLKKKVVEETFDPLQSGGLGDEDVSSTRPNFPRTLGPRPQIPNNKDLKRDCSWTNNVGTTGIFSWCLASC